jgi:hypothetical protein
MQIREAILHLQNAWSTWLLGQAVVLKSLHNAANGQMLDNSTAFCLTNHLEQYVRCLKSIPGLLAVRQHEVPGQNESIDNVPWEIVIRRIKEHRTDLRLIEKIQPWKACANLSISRGNSLRYACQLIIKGDLSFQLKEIIDWSDVMIDWFDSTILRLQEELKKEPIEVSKSLKATVTTVRKFRRIRKPPKKAPTKLTQRTKSDHVLAGNRHLPEALQMGWD